tara:strand:- start:43 stop:924 length:882 start_codon:yes stop_codon:yes gene_type:complete
MNISIFSKGIIFASLGSFWWGIIGTIYFQYFSYIGHLELVIHRCVWTSLILIITTTILNKWKLFKITISNKKKLFILFITGLLIFSNWATWIYAVASEKIINASFGYFIMPIINVLFGYTFFKEKINKKIILSILIVFFVVIYLLLMDYKSIPLIGIFLSIVWSLYNLLRKTINVDTEIGLLIESFFILPFALVGFYFIYINGLNDFSLSNIPLIPLLMLAGPMTVIPLFFYIKGFELSGLGPTGMIFFITPTCHFLLGFFYFNETFSITNFVSFAFIWIAVIVYLSGIYEKN